MADKKAGVFFEGSNWCHRVRILQEDGTTKYSKRRGFKTAKEAEASYRKYDEEYKKAYRAYHAASAADFGFKEFLDYWLDEIYRTRIESTTYMLASYTLYNLILPNMNQEILCGWHGAYQAVFRVYNKERS